MIYPDDIITHDISGTSTASISAMVEKELAGSYVVVHKRDPSPPICLKTLKPGYFGEHAGSIFALLRINSVNAHYRSI